MQGVSCEVLTIFFDAELRVKVARISVCTEPYHKTVYIKFLIFQIINPTRNSSQIPGFSAVKTIKDATHSRSRAVCPEDHRQLLSNLILLV